VPFGVVCTCFGILNYFHLANFETFMIWHRTLPGSQHEGAQQQRMRSSRSWRPGAALLSTPTSCRRASRRSSLPCLLEMCILHVQCQLPLVNFKIGVLPASFDANLRFQDLCAHIQASEKTCLIHCNSGVQRSPRSLDHLMAAPPAGSHTPTAKSGPLTHSSSLAEVEGTEWMILTPDGDPMAPCRPESPGLSNAGRA